MDVERLLGTVLRSGLSKNGMGKMARNAAFSREGMTLLAGIGIAAFEHFRGRQGQSPSPAAPAGFGQTPPSFGTAAPPAAPPTGSVAPPPFPGRTAVPPPPPPKPADKADLLLAAMVAAANADGMLDAAERAAMLDYLDTAGADADDRTHLGRLLADPPDAAAIAARVNDPATAAEVWAAARLAIEPDTAAEQDFLADLADRMGLDTAAIEQIEARLVEAGACGHA